MKTWILSLTVAVAAALSLAPLEADAKRLGGGKSQGMQRDMPARTAPDAAPGKPATPQQAANPAAPNAAAAPAAAPKRSWMGPLAGLAAGLGLAALFGALGMSEAVGSMLMMVLLAVVAFIVIRLLLRRFASSRVPANVSAYQGSGGAGAGQVAWPQAGATPAAGPLAAGTSAPVLDAPAEPAAASAASTPAVAKAFVPAAFDSESFQRAAKLIFIRLQAANDAADLDDLRSFTTPELFASIRLDLQDRGAKAQATDVVRVEAEVIDVAQEETRQVVSVRFHGDVREEAGAAPTPFNEVWHLVKPQDGSRDWAVAGIEQLN